MDTLDEFLETIDKPEHREKLATVIQTIPIVILNLLWKSNGINRCYCTKKMALLF